MKVCLRGGSREIPIRDHEKGLAMQLAKFVMFRQQAIGGALLDPRSDPRGM